MKRTDIENIIKLGEGQECEFKRSVSAGLGKEICAMANAIGGRILVGVEDNGVIVGIGNPNRAKSEIQDIARNMVPPLRVQIKSAGTVLVVEIPESVDKPHCAGGKYYLREGANSQLMNRDELREFFFREGLLYFDEMPNRKFTFPRHVASDTYRRFVRASGIPDDLKQENVLSNLKVLQKGEMTNAGALIFGQHGSDFLISATITCALFQGTDKVKVLDQKIYDDDLFTNYNSAMTYLLAHLDTEYIIGITRVNRLELPETALREALLNAIAHRSYRSTANIQIYIFKDRVEIVNPGGLVAGLKKEDLGCKSMPRNPLLFSLMHRMHMVENIGSGYKRINDAVKEYEAAEPRIDADEHWFSFTFFRPSKSEKKTDGGLKAVKGKAAEVTKAPKGSFSGSATQETTQEKILSFLRVEPEITRKKLAEKIGISTDGIKYHLEILRKARKIRHIGATKKGRWEVAENKNE